MIQKNRQGQFLSWFHIGIFREGHEFTSFIDGTMINLASCLVIVLVELASAPLIAARWYYGIIINDPNILNHMDRSLNRT